MQISYTVERRLSELMWGEGCSDNRKVHIIKHLVIKSLIQLYEGYKLFTATLIKYYTLWFTTKRCYCFLFNTGVPFSCC